MHLVDERKIGAGGKAREIDRAGRSTSNRDGKVGGRDITVSGGEEILGTTQESGVDKRCALRIQLGKKTAGIGSLVCAICGREVVFENGTRNVRIPIPINGDGLTCARA